MLKNILQKCLQLRKFNLSDNNIEDTEASALAEVLKMNTSLQNLELMNNRIGEKGAIALADALKTNTALQNLNLYGSNEARYVSAFVCLAFQLTTARVHPVHSPIVNGVGDSGAIALANALKTNTGLQNLNLEHNGVGEKGAIALADALKTNTGLQNLNLYRTALRFCVRLFGLPADNRARTSVRPPIENGVGEKGAIALADALKTNTGLQNLSLGPDNRARPSRAFTCREWCWREGSHRTSRLVENEHGPAEPEPRPNEARYVFAFTYLAFQLTTTCVQSPVDNDVGEKGAIALANSLKTNTGLQNLNLERTNETHYVFAFVCLAFQLTTARVHPVHCLVDNGVGDPGAIALADALKANTGLQNLNLYPRYVFAFDCLAFQLTTARAHPVRSPVENGIGEKGAIALADALKTNTDLQNLNLDGNGVGEKGAIALADALKTNTGLQNLSLGRTVGDPGAIVMADALKTNTGLQNLNLNRSHRTSRRAENEHGPAEPEPTLYLTTTRVHPVRSPVDNRVGEKGAIALADALKTNTGLQNLSLGST
ncbi:LOW QUALITY PROTEIN: hypothetical protein BC938DRAFT_479210, partial [Jimgerdemannia flammicorona]